MLRRAAAVAGALAAVLLAFFATNGLHRGSRTPALARGDGGALAGPVRELRVMAPNRAKAGFFAGGWSRTRSRWRSSSTAWPR